MKVKEMKADPGSGAAPPRDLATAQILKIPRESDTSKMGQGSQLRRKRAKQSDMFISRKKTSAEMLVVMEMVRQYAMYKNSNMGALCVRD